jgi:hypothetical protein
MLKRMLVTWLLESFELTPSTLRYAFSRCDCPVKRSIRFPFRDQIHESDCVFRSSWIYKSLCWLHQPLEPFPRSSQTLKKFPLCEIALQRSTFSCHFYCLARMFIHLPFRGRLFVWPQHVISFLIPENSL